jgi:tight adherence protein B
LSRGGTGGVRWVGCEGVSRLDDAGRFLGYTGCGVDITEALDGVGSRMASEDFGWVVMAISIQREVGGNLAEILQTVGETLREREYLRRQVRALSAEGRLSGYILVALPVLIFVYMLFANPDYVRPLYTTGMGIVLLAVAGSLLALGSWAMKKIAVVEV